MKNVSIYFLMIILILISLLINACDLSSKIEITKSTQESGPSEVIDSVNIVSTNGNVLDWKITAEKIDRFPDSQRWIGHKVRFESVSDTRTVITCNEADIDELSNVIKGKGNVIIDSPKGYLKTELLIFNRFTNEIHAPGFVYLKKGYNIIKGTDLTTNIDFDNIYIKNVSGQGVMDEALTY